MAAAFFFLSTIRHSLRAARPSNHRIGKPHSSWRRTTAPFFLPEGSAFGARQTEEQTGLPFRLFLHTIRIIILSNRSGYRLPILQMSGGQVSKAEKSGLLSMPEALGLINRMGC